MITLTKNGNAVKFQFEDSQHYLMGDGEIEVPVNSLSLIIDESKFVTFKKASSDDIFVSFDPADSNLSTKDGVIQFYKENMVGSTGGGSGSGVTSGQVESMISEALEDYPTNDDVDETLEDYYTKDEVDAGFASIQDEIDEKEEVISTSLNDLNDRMDDKAETSAVTALNSSLTAHTADTAIHTTAQEKAAWNAKQTALTAGTGIDITNNVISVTASTGGSNVIELTQAQYEALVDKDPDVIYVITDAPEINISGKADTSAVTVVTDALTAHTANTTAHTTSAEKTTWNGKQDALVSGTNIKTINNQSLLGSGNIDIQGGGGGISSAQCQTMIEDYCDPKEEVIATALVDLNDRVEDLESGGTGVTIATAITSSSTNSEAAGALATYNAITAATTGGGTTYTAGTNISIDTANTINCTLPISSIQGYNGIIVGNGSSSGQGYRHIIGGLNCSASPLGSGGIPDNCLVIGNHLEAHNSEEVAFGKYNSTVRNTSVGGSSGITALSIGNGGNSNSQRHNAFEVRKNGDIYFPDTDNTTYQNDYEKPMVRLQDMYGALGGLKFVKLTQSEYDQLATKDANTLYIITNVVS